MAWMSPQRGVQRFASTLKAHGRIALVSARGKCTFGVVNPYPSSKGGGRMLEKQEHLYSTLFTSGQVLVERHGPPEVTEALTEALRLQWSYGFPYTPRTLPLLTHAFGDYPAGMQAAAAHHLLNTVLPGRTVFDPFLGGGTVVVEALRAGRLGIGSDVSPLALFVARGRSWIASDTEIEELCEASRSICAAVALKLGDARSRQISGQDWEVVRSEISKYIAAKEASGGTLEDGLRDGLWFLFAVAGGRAAKARRRPNNGNVVAHHFFHSVCVQYISAVKRLTSSPFPQKPLIFRRDAREPLDKHNLQSLVGVKDGESELKTADFVVGGSTNTGPGGEGEYNIRCGSVVDTVLTSPPYPGVYDYLSHARLARSKLGCLSTTRCRDGGNDASLFLDPVPSGRNWESAWTAGEVGAKSETRRRRRSKASSYDHDMWENDQKDWLLATTGALRTGGRLGIMIGDGDGIDTRSSLLGTVEMLGKEVALEVIGWVTLRAAEGTRRSMRTEHLVLLEKT